VSTYEVKRAGRLDWSPAGETVEEAETAVQTLNDRAQPSTIVLLRNNFNGSVTVFETFNLGRPTNHGPYQRFYATERR
jgi:hypothetical protein